MLTNIRNFADWHNPGKGAVAGFFGPAMVVDPNGEIGFVNHQARTLLQCRVGGNLQTCCSPEQFAAFESYRDVIVTDPKLRFHMALELEGTDGPAPFEAAPLPDPAGVPYGFMIRFTGTEVSNGTDTTPDDTTDAFRWQTVLDSANQGAWDHDFERDRHYLSDTWRKIRGLPPGAPVAETTEDWLATIHPDDVGNVRSQLALLDSGATDAINYKFRQRHASGSWIWILSRGQVVRRNEKGLPSRIIGTDTDITDIKSVERDRARLTERLDLALDAARMGRWELDLSSLEMFWDDRLLNTLGITDGRNTRAHVEWRNYVHPDDRIDTQAQLRKSLDERRNISCDFRVITRQGTEKFIRIRGAFVRDQESGNRYSGVCLDLTEDYRKSVLLKKTRDSLEYESRHDALTGLANRRHLDHQYRQIMSEPAWQDVEQAVMHIDVDHFKKVNDTLGHDAGDAVLVHIADVLRKYAGDDTLIARVGGDEFVVLFPAAPDDAYLTRIAQKIIDELIRPFEYGNTRCDLGASIGIAKGQPDWSAPRQIFIDADLALYRAKSAGRGRVRLFDREMRAVAARRKSIQEALKAGVDNGEFICHYQPQYDAQTLELSGLEALIRWESPSHGLVLPGEFLPDAAEMGLCEKLDEIVLQRAIADANAWRAAGLPVPRMAVNVSARRIAEQDLLPSVSKLDIPPGTLSFELVESAFLDAVDEDVNSNLRGLTHLGIDIEIDDFGTGHASIAGLLNIAPRRLKIDRSLVQPVVTSPQRRQLLETLVNIGRMLQIGVVAEGVESKSHIPILRDMGCEALQGFALSRPVPPDRIVTMLTDGRKKT